MSQQSQSKSPEKLDAAHVFQRNKLEDANRCNAKDDDEDIPNSIWDPRDEQVEEKA